MPLPQGKDAGIQGSNLQRHQPNKAEGYFGFVMWQAQDFETAIVRGFTPLVSWSSHQAFWDVGPLVAALPLRSTSMLRLFPLQQLPGFAVQQSSCFVYAIQTC